MKNSNIKVSKRKNNTFRTAEVVFLLLVTCIVSLIMGYLVSNSNDTNQATASDEKLEEFIENYNYILENYYDEVDSDTLLTGAIEGMMSSLGDEYSTMIDSDSSNNFDVRLQGTYEGIGIEIVNDEDNNIVIYGIIEDSPAADSDLKIGDIVKKIDDVDLTGKNVSELSGYVHNSNKKTLKMIILRDGQEKEIKIERKYVTLKSVSSQVFERNDKKIGYIYISIFSAVTDSQFKSELENLEKNGIDSLIIDVRDNTGGHLTSVENILSQIMDSSHVIYQTETKKGISKKHSTGSVNKNYPIVVLQNENSASASELLSSSLKEGYGATIVGKKSYGKGTVQELISLSNGEEFKFTTKKWLTPQGNWINKKGVEVDIEVEMNEEYYNNPNDDNDNQLQKALEYLQDK